MNKGNKQIVLFLLAISVVTTVPVYGMEGIAENTAPAQQVCVWYKKRSIQIAAAVATCMMASYVIAVCMGKISSPKALLNLLTTPLVKHNNNVQPDNSALNTNDVIVEDNNIKLDDDKINKNDKDDKSGKMPLIGYRVGPDETNKQSVKDSIKEWFYALKN